MLSPRQLCQIFIPASFALVGMLFYLLSDQYVLGFEFDPSVEESLIVTNLSDSYALQGLHYGDEVVSIITDKEELTLSSALFPLSLSERRKSFHSVEDYYSQQDTIRNVLSQASNLKLVNGQLIPYSPKTFDINEIPLSVISSVFCGLLAWLLTMIVWIWYPTKLPAICLMVNGFGFYLMAISSALLSEGLAVFSFSFSLLLHYLFFVGHVLFLTFGLCVLVYFPVALTRAEILKNIILLLGIFFLIFIVWSKWQPHLDWHNQQILVSSYELYSFIGGCFLIALILCFLQWQSTSENRSKRIHLYWVIASWIVAPILYIVFYMLPMAFDQQPLMTRSVTWVVMSLCYVLLLIAIWRFDLLYLNQHLKRATNWLFTIILLLILDLVVLFAVYVNYDGSVLGGLAIVIWGYFPIRYTFKHLLYRSNDERGKSEFHNAIRALFKKSDYDIYGEHGRDVKWSGFLNLAFNPMSISESRETSASRIMEQGQGLHIEANSYSPALLIRHAQRGSRRFDHDDLEMVGILYLLFEQISQFKSAFLAGQRQERQRIRRDLHDQIAFQLVSLIYSNNLNQSREIAKSTLSELRLLIKALQPGLADLISLQNQLKKLAHDFCQVAELDLAWEITNTLPNLKVSGRQFVNLMSVMKELLVNIQRHSKAKRVIIKVVFEDNQLIITVHDNGVGVGEIESTSSNGINNLRSRVKEIHGTITWSTIEGTLVSICVPIQTKITGDQDEGAYC